MPAFQDLLNRLVAWVSSSQGTPIRLPSGKRMAFARVRSFSDAALTALSRRYAYPIPSEYSMFLREVGISILFRTAEGEIEFYDPDEVESLYRDFFENASEALERLLPVACDTRLQEVAVYFLDRESGPNLVVMPHDTPPEDWEDLADEEGLWTTLGAWLGEAIATEGEMAAH